MTALTSTQGHYVAVGVECGCSHLAEAKQLLVTFSARILTFRLAFHSMYLYNTPQSPTLACLLIMVGSAPQTAIDETYVPSHRSRNHDRRRNHFVTTVELRIVPLRPDSNAESSHLDE